MIASHSSLANWRASLLVFLALTAHSTVEAFVSYLNDAGQPQKWNLTNPSGAVHTNVLNRNTRAVRYFLAADAFSSANNAAELEAARACFDQWQAVPGSILRFEEGGVVSGKPDVNTTDNTNLVFWAKNTTIVNGGFDNISGATAVTFADYFSDSTLAEADIVLNGAQFVWFTDFGNTANKAQFVESVLLHEIGHFIGLAHSPVGASTMFPRGGGGVNVQSGLSPDEIAAVHALYPSASTPAALARLFGRVTLDGKPVFGALILAEDAAGNIAAGTVTRTNGTYTMPAMPPGSFLVRATPVDPAGAGYALFRGPDIAQSFSGAEPGFLPTANTPANLTAGGEAAVNFAVTAGIPVFRVGRLWPPSSDPSIKVVVNYPISISAGQSDLVVGVYSSDIPGANTRLRVTGDGVTFGTTTVQMNAFPGVNPPLNLISVPLGIAANATPGLRSFVVEHDSGLAYANGFLEILPPFPDFNFDGLDDAYQRQFFARWTVPNAAPSANPDGDLYNNAEEYLAGTNPIDPQSVLRVESVRIDEKGTTISWLSAPGKRFQVLSRPRVNSIRGWQTIGQPVTSSGGKAEFLDTSAAAQQQFFRVQALP